MIHFNAHLGLLVLDAMCLVNDDVLPDEFAQLRLYLQHHLVGRHADVEFLWENRLANHRIL